MAFMSASILSVVLVKLKRCYFERPEIVFHLAAFFANQNSIDHPENDLMVIRNAALEEARQSGALQRSADAYTNLSTVSKEDFEHLLPPVVLGMPDTLGAAERGPVSEPGRARARGAQLGRTSTAAAVAEAHASQVAIPATAVHPNNVSSPVK